jgi:hypothetical protein
VNDGVPPFLACGARSVQLPIGYRDGTSPAMGDSASPLDQRKTMTGEPIALLWVALTSRTLQCLYSSAA